MTDFLLDDFEALEIQHDLYSLEYDGINPWELVRFDVVQELRQQLTGGSNAHDRPEGLSAYVRSLKLVGKNVVQRNPLVSDPHEFLFFGHPRRKRLNDGFWWDLYCDPIHDGADLDYLHLEYSDFLTHSTPAKTEQLRYMDLVDLPSVLAGKIGFPSIEFPIATETRLRNFEAAIHDKYGVDIAMCERVSEKLRERRIALPLYKRIIQRVDPKVVILVVSYGRGIKTIIEACRNLSIPVVELQHGVIYPGHPGYNYPKDVSVDLFPDYLFTFGEFWNGQAAYPIDSDKLVAVGYPYLEQRIGGLSSQLQNKQIVFLSQGTIGVELSKFAVKVHESPDIEHEVIYKLHPGEYDRWRNSYPWLTDSGLTVVDSSDPPLYDLFAQSTVQVGVGSTAVYEGLAFNLKTFVYDCSGYEVLSSLVSDGTATLVSAPGELADTIETSQTEFNRNQYFRQESLSNIKLNLQEIKHLTR